MNLCAFCGHPEGQHGDGIDGPRSCFAVVCGDPQENRGRCAIFTSKEHHAENMRWFAAYENPVTVMPSDVANIIHKVTGHQGEHHLALSCSCAHTAMAMLGIDIDL